MGFGLNERNYCIAKAVKLADGFSETTFLYYGPGLSPVHKISVKSKSFLSALAAQLVSQVHETEHYFVRIFARLTEVREIIDQCDYPHTKCSGEDTTMNTIKCIIDSKVLENERK